MKDNLLKKFLEFSYGSWIGLIIGLGSTMITTRILSPDDFGKASMFTLTINICMILIIFGTDQSFVRFFYEEEEKNRGGLLFNCLNVPIVILILVVFFIIIFKRQITVFLFNEESLVIALILAVGIITQVLNRYGILIIRMQQKGNLFSIIQILNKVLNFMFILLLYLILGSQYQIIIYSFVITSVILTIISIVYEKKYWKSINFTKNNLKHGKVEILKYAYPLVFTTLITWLFESFDKIAIKQWSSFNELGVYSAAYKIVALLIVVQSSFTTFWTPVCYETYEKNPENKDFYKKMFRIVSFVMFSIAILCIAGKDIIVALLGTEYREASKIMPFLVFMPIMYTLSETTVIGINFYKKPRWHIFIASISCLVNILGNWMLVPRYGAIGASIATALSYVVFFSLRTFISLKYYKVRYGLKKTYIMIFIILLYAVYSIKNVNFLMDMLVGMGILLFMCLFYYKDLVKAYRNYIGSSL